MFEQIISTLPYVAIALMLSFAFGIVIFSVKEDGRLEFGIPTP